MTIRQFARLCGCNPQTLRYYDRVELLKPVQVDKWTGYRYYDEEQALAFVKIRNLQKAGFTIEEIKALLDRDNQAIFQAFEAKIAEAEERLREIREIQRSYQSEMESIKGRISEVKEKINQAMKAYDPREEFGIGAEEYDKIVSGIESMLEAMGACDEARFDFQEDGDKTDLLDDPMYERVYEKHGWSHVKDFLAEFSDLEDSGEYMLIFRVDEEKDACGMAFANTVLNVLLNRNPGKKKTLGCDVKASEDGENHFWFLKKRT